MLNKKIKEWRGVKIIISIKIKIKKRERRIIKIMEAKRKRKVDFKLKKIVIGLKTIIRNKFI